jgi:putative phosphoserine phosphatase / 1-acylglycerol-3-phosphate O-acyltransferase
MARYKNYLEEVLKSERGPEIGALFDFDGTIIAGYSATAFLREKISRREMSAEEILSTANVVTQYTMGGIGFSGLMTSAARLVKGMTEDSYAQFGEELYAKHIARKIYPESRALIEAHLAKGHTVAIISSATIYQIEPTARDLGVKHVLCSQYEVKRGVFTGNIIRPLCFGQGKVVAAEKLAAEQGVDLDRSFFYTNNDDDVQLWNAFGRPRPLNPNRKLAGMARKKNWPVEKYESRRTPSVLDYARTIAATSTLAGAFAAGLPIWALTRSRREATNFSTGLFADVSSAITGVKVEVTGEHHLWSHRPAVFIFNHQSKADVMIMAKLVRRDMGGVAKKEVGQMPIIGQLFKYAGAVFVDRKNSANAIKAMEPLVDAIQKEGKSICIAPEGTRTLTPKLGPFKKGAFHLAIQAGAPIVPVVIHNSVDVAPKNDFVLRAATVKVDVLPPVDTSKWKASTIDAHVEDVRKLYLNALGQSGKDTNVIAHDMAGGKARRIRPPKPKALVKPAKRRGKSGQGASAEAAE